MKILMRRLVRSRLIWIYTICKCVSELTWCLNLPNFTLIQRLMPLKDHNMFGRILPLRKRTIAVLWMNKMFELRSVTSHQGTGHAQTVRIAFSERALCVWTVGWHSSKKKMCMHTHLRRTARERSLRNWKLSWRFYFLVLWDHGFHCGTLKLLEDHWWSLNGRN